MIKRRFRFSFLSPRFWTEDPLLTLSLLFSEEIAVSEVFLAIQEAFTRKRSHKKSVIPFIFVESQSNTREKSLLSKFNVMMGWYDEYLKSRKKCSQLYW